MCRNALGIAASLTLTFVGTALAQEPVAKQDTPATTGTIFQHQPKTDGKHSSVVTAPGVAGSGSTTTDPTVGVSAGQPSRSEPRTSPTGRSGDY